MDIFDGRYLKMNKSLLSIFGLWPYQDGSKKLYLQLFFVSFSVVSSLPQLYGLAKNFGVRMDKAIEHATLIIYIYGITLKLATSILSESKLEKVYRRVAENWQSIRNRAEIEILREYSERGRRLTIAYIAYMANALLFFICLPMAPAILNYALPLDDGNASRPLDFVMHGEFPCDDMYDYYLEIYAFDCCTCIATVFIFCTIDCTYVACVEHCLGLFAIVKHRLQRATLFSKHSAHNNRIIYDYVVDTVKLHKKIIEFTDILESSYSLSFLILMGMNMIYCSFVCVLLLIRSDDVMERIRWTGILFGLLIHLFYISWPGQKLIDHSEGLFDDAYCNEWYECSIETKNLLIVMRLRCLKPCQLTAGTLYVMNFANFAMITKTSMSYITVLSSFT
ncbi:hypothetical protein TKK_0015877 [Trichogramma kaykai]|uniref:Odorant receptor n=1 Tax=Trichogramma kaykai TaxID=54128 RepID=A0ABD2W8Q5_9HYME